MTDNALPPAEDPTWTVSDLERDLGASLEKLREHLDAFRIRQVHFAADLTLWGLAVAAWDAGNAVLLISKDGRFVVGAFPIVRAAVEVGQDALYLATDPDHDALGAKARVFERLEYANIRTDLGSSFDVEGIGLSDAEYDQIAKSVEADAISWERDCPGKGQLLRDALAMFLPLFKAARTGSRHPMHWAQRTRWRLAEELEQRTGQSGLAKKFMTSYSILSRNSHPRTRLETWVERKTPEGTIRVRGEHNTRLALSYVCFGLDLVNDALDAAATWF
jgi:hypothetical protein